MSKLKSASKLILMLDNKNLIAPSKLDIQLTKSKLELPVEETFEENFIRRERRRKKETKEEIQRLRDALPVYDIDAIRQFKMPYYEALMLQLQETGYHGTEDYIKQLVEMNERSRKEAGFQNVLYGIPLLKDSSNELKILSDGLKKAEDEHNAGNNNKEIDVLLELAIDFGFNYSMWFWVAEELILQCLGLSQNKNLTGKHEAMVRYTYGKLLIDRVKDYDKAGEHLLIVKDLSRSKSWNIKRFFPEDQQKSTTLYMNANYLLHFCYMRNARVHIKTDIQKALELATLAKKSALEACYPDGETKALFLKGQCEMNTGNTKSAVQTFIKAYYIQSRLKSLKGMCEARVELSKAYLLHGETRLALDTILALKQTAKEHGLLFYLAQAYRYLGEYYLNYGEPQRATPFLLKALKIFHENGNAAEADQVRNLEALSCGLELMPIYVSLVQKTDARCPDWFDNLMKLVKWKDSRTPFWTEQLNSPSSSTTLINTSGTTAREGSVTTEYEDLCSIFEARASDEDLENDDIEIAPPPADESMFPTSDMEIELTTENTTNNF